MSVERGLPRLEQRLRRLQANMAELERLDRAAGEYKPALSIGGWIRERMRTRTKPTPDV